MFEMLHRWDVWLFYVINQKWRWSVFDILMPVASDLRYFIIPLLVLSAALILRNRKRGILLFIFALLAVGLGDQVSSSLIKPRVGRYRPCNERGGIHLFIHHKWEETPLYPGKLYKPRKSYSFPSSHATNCFAAATIFALFIPSGAPLFFLMAAIVAYSRVYLGVHYPLDVLGGALLGVCCGAFWYLLYRDFLRTFALPKVCDSHLLRL